MCPSLDHQAPTPPGRYEFATFVVLMAVIDTAFMYGLIEKAAAIVAQLAVALGR